MFEIKFKVKLICFLSVCYLSASQRAVFRSRLIGTEGIVTGNISGTLIRH